MLEEDNLTQNGLNFFEEFSTKRSERPQRTVVLTFFKCNSSFQQREAVQLDKKYVVKISVLKSWLRLPYSAFPRPAARVSLQTNSRTKQKSSNAFTYLGIVRKSPDNSPLSAPKIGVHHTSMSFSGPSKNPTLSISRIHATDDLSYEA